MKQTNEAKYGEYQCNNAMALHGKLKARGAAGAYKAPRDVASAIVARAQVEPLRKSLSSSPLFFSCQLPFA